MNKSLKTFGALALVLAVGLVSASAAPKKKAAGPKTLTVDTQASSVKWTGKKVTGQHDGSVALKSGSVTMDGAKLTGGEFTADMASIKVNDIKDEGTNAKLVGHLKSPDFFDVEKHPAAMFKITQVAAGAAAGQYNATGDLTIKGITQPATVPVTVTMADGKAEAKGTLTVDRTKYEIKYGSGKFFKGLGDKVIHDDFTLDFHLVAK